MLECTRLITIIMILKWTINIILYHSKIIKNLINNCENKLLFSILV